MRKAKHTPIHIGPAAPLQKRPDARPLFAALALALFLFNVSTAQAIAVRVDSSYLQSGGSGNTLLTEAFFDTKDISGIGRETAQVGVFRLIFSDFGIRSAIIPAPSDSFVAVFDDGDFSGLGIGGQFLLTPDRPLFSFSKDNQGRLIVNFRISGRRNYNHISTSEPIPLNIPGVPLPGALLLLGTSLGALCFMRRRRKTA